MLAPNVNPHTGLTLWRCPYLIAILPSALITERTAHTRNMVGNGELERVLRTIALTQGLESPVS